MSSAKHKQDDIKERTYKYLKRKSQPPAHGIAWVQGETYSRQPFFSYIFLIIYL